jgi:hypothetical protein
MSSRSGVTDWTALAKLWVGSTTAAWLWRTVLKETYR